MKLNLFILMQLSAFLFSDAFAQSISQQSIFNIIPQPVKIQPAQGMFNLDTTVKIEVSSSDKEVWKTAYLFSKKILVPTGYHLKVVGTVTKKEKAICLVLNTIPDDVLGKEGYVLEVNPDRINIRANKPAGIFYGIQTLMQILPPGIENKSKITHENWNIHCVSILDYPRFGWRGLMLDVSRHFFQKGFVEKYIDQMTKYKYNVFHWHLTDDNGWRIEINGLPRLTKIGAWRAPRTGDWGSFDIAQPGEKATYGGYYTQEDIKEIVEYARERFVTIVPEVDVPAHSLALIASYPNLSCTQLQYQVGVGRIKNTVDNVLCVANDSTWLLLNKIFTQIAALFPGQYIHVGGDEAYKGFWEQHWKDRALMKREGLGNTKELQSYFEKKLEKLIISKGKKMIGWDE
ncbi:MAG TPA: beta-N-acetylhexosaminidase, partial [Hanamia sp.]|nr:beta-N-acetylhexosaminidase [Hanamia sp.]